MDNFWEEKKKELDWLPNGSFNAAYQALDANIKKGNSEKTAYIFEDENGNSKTFTFKELLEKTNQFANLLSSFGVLKGDRVFLFLPRIPETYYSFLGILKTGAIAGTMFSAFGKDALKDRLENSGAKVLVTTKELLGRVEPIRKELPQLSEVLVIDDPGFSEKLERESKEFETYPTKPEDYSFMLYTSGTTGKPKGVVHAHISLLQQIETAKLALDLKEGDIYWCTADPGWVTGIVYSILSNLSLGVTTLIHQGRFDQGIWYKLIEKHKVTVWYTAPTAVRMLMAKGDLYKDFDLSSLRYMASVGEPLNPEAVEWSKKAFNMPFYDNWWQTETGSIQIANIKGQEVRPGSMGKPLPWVKAEIIDEKGNPLSAETEGNLALKPPWPSMMRSIWKNQEKYLSYFNNDWYFSGDRARKDKDGYFWFIGRADDVIKTSGERVGPFEVESALVEYPGVVEAGVIGKPDEVRGEIIKAFVVLGETLKPSEELKEKLKEHVKSQLAGHAYPREIEFIDKLPKTRSGKIMRRILKAKELGQPVGDTSTLEEY